MRLRIRPRLPSSACGPRAPPNTTPNVDATRCDSDHLHQRATKEAEQTLPPRPPKDLGDTPNPRRRQIVRSARPKRHGLASQGATWSEYRPGGEAGRSTAPPFLAAHGSRQVIAVSGTSTSDSRLEGWRRTANFPAASTFRYPGIDAAGKRESKLDAPGRRRANLSGGRIVASTPRSNATRHPDPAAALRATRGRPRAASHRLARGDPPADPNSYPTPPP